MQTGTRLECQKCGEIVTVQGPGEAPPCRCGVRNWRTMSPADQPSVPFALSDGDQRMLHRHHALVQRRLSDGRV